MSKKQLRIPEVGERLRLTGTLVDIQDVTPPPPAKQLDYVFEEVTARVELAANGHVIDERGTFNDFGGCAERTAIAEAEKLAKQFGPGVEVRVVRIVERYRARPNDYDYEDLYNRGFPKFERLQHGYHAGMPEPTETIVWSSHKEGGEA